MKFKNDIFKKVRGGYSRLLEIRCRKCEEFICYYQKDGPGGLRRMYLDRMFEPTVPVSKKALSCSEEHILGMKIIHEKGKEKRPAFRLFADSVVKKIVKSG